MRTRHGSQSGLLGRVLLGGAALMTALGVTVGLLAAAGRIDLPWMKRPLPPPPGPPEGTIPVPITTQPIPAYTRLTRDHFWDARTKSFTVMHLYPREIGSGMLTNMNEILGRVLATDKKPGYAVTERELLPKGTRAGLAGGIPPGKRAMVLEASRIHGIYGLQRGDHLDLLASVPIETKPNAGRDARSILQSLRPSASAMGASAKRQANVIVLAEDAVLVAPVVTRYLPPPNGAKTKGGATGKPVEEVVIAVDPSEVTRISEALAVDASITAVAQSGRPDSPKGSVKPVPAPVDAEPTAIEVIRGGKRSTVIFTPDGKRVTDAPGSPDVVSSDATARR